MNHHMIAAAALAIGLTTTAIAQTDLLAYWNFNDSTAGSSGGLGTLDTFDGTGFPADVGNGLLTTNFDINTVAGTNTQNDGDLGTFAGTTLNALFSDPAGGALAVRGDNNNGKWIQFEISMTGYQNLEFTFAGRGTGTGYDDNQVSYSTDGINFTDFDDPYDSSQSSFELYEFDFGSLLDDEATVHIRITFDGATSSLGNNRLDNVQFNATPISTGPVAVSLNVDEACYSDGVGDMVTVTIDLTGDGSTEIVGGQFFLEYDASVLEFVSADPAGPPFELEIFEFHVPGLLDYAVGVSHGGSGTTGNATMAVLTFEALQEVCDVDNLVTFRPNNPPTRLTDNFGGEVLADLDDLGPITIDGTPPVITIPSDVTVQCHADAHPGLPFATGTGGIAVYYNPGMPEHPDHQWYMRAQFQAEMISDPNGSSLVFSDTPLVGIGLTWQDIFGHVDIGGGSQFGFDLILEMPTATQSAPTLTAWTNTDNTPAGAQDDGPVAWAINDYKGASPNGPANPNTVPIHSLFRGDDVVITTNRLTVDGTEFTVEIAGYLESDGLIHWYSVGELGSNGDGTSNMSDFALNGRIYFAGTLIYDAATDPFAGQGMDFYAGTITFTANAPSSETGFATAIDNCTLFPEISFSDVDNGGSGCPGDPLIITRTWSAEDECGNVATGDQTITVIDDIAPTVVWDPADQLGVYADAGFCDAVVTWDEPVAGVDYWDNCTPDNNITVTSSHEPGDAFPAGQTTIVTYWFEDACGNVSSVSFDVEVLGVSQMVVDVSLQNVDPGPFDRCIEFELTDGSGNVIETVSQTLTFVNGQATAMIDVPCSAGGYGTCLAARGPLHTLRSTGDLSVDGTEYVADGFDPLRGGDLNDDGVIDILDFGVFVWQFSSSPGANTDCSQSYQPGVFAHADISGDGVVDAADFTFIQINFLQMDAACAVQVMARMLRPRGGEVEPAPGRTSITVRELHAKGLGHLAVADLNNDGVVDATDIALFLGGATP